MASFSLIDDPDEIVGNTEHQENIKTEIEEDILELSSDSEPPATPTSIETASPLVESGAMLINTIESRIAKLFHQKTPLKPTEATSSTPGQAISSSRQVISSPGQAVLSTVQKAITSKSGQAAVFTSPNVTSSAPRLHQMIQLLLNPAHVASSTSGQATLSASGQETSSIPRQIASSTRGQAVLSTVQEAVTSKPGQAIVSPPQNAKSSTPRLHEMIHLLLNPAHVASSTSGQPTSFPPEQDTLSTPRQISTSTPGQVSSSIPSQITSATPGQIASSPSGQIASSTPGQAASSVPIQVASSAPEQVSSSAPRQAASSTPRQAASFVPGQVASSASVQVTSSAPGQIESSTPGKTVSSTPRQISSSTSGQIASSASGQIASSTPGQIASAIPEHPEQIASTAFGQIVSATSGQIASATFGHIASSTLRQIASSTPGQIAPFALRHIPPTPGQVTSSILGQDISSTLGQVTSCTVGQIALSTPGQITAPTPRESSTVASGNKVIVGMTTSQSQLSAISSTTSKQTSNGTASLIPFPFGGFPTNYPKATGDFGIHQHLNFQASNLKLNQQTSVTKNIDGSSGKLLETIVIDDDDDDREITAPSVSTSGGNTNNTIVPNGVFPYHHSAGMTALQSQLTVSSSTTSKQTSNGTASQTPFSFGSAPTDFLMNFQKTVGGFREIAAPSTSNSGGNASNSIVPNGISSYNYNAVHWRHKLHACEICGRTFKKYCKLKIHMDTHSTSRPYQCDLCSSYFKSRGSIWMHMQKHNNKDSNKKCLCDKCGKFYLSGQNYRDHWRTHIQVPKLICDKCGQNFSSLDSFNIHCNEHENICFICNECKRPFPHRVAFLSHLKHKHPQLVGTGPKRYVCNICNVSTVNLTKHMVTHTRERKFHCHLCNKCFMYRYDLNKHLKSSIHALVIL